MGVIAVVNTVWMMAIDYGDDDSRRSGNAGVVNGDCGKDDIALVTMATGNIDPMQRNEKPMKF